MTATTPDLAATPPPRRGFFAPRWLVYTLGGLVLLAIGFVVGRRVGRNHDRGRGPGRFEGRARFGDHHDAAGRGLGLLIAIVVLVLIVAGIVALVRHFSAARHEGAASAERVLEDRFARGEIDEEEFLRRRAALRA
jgi:putative membrane protein